MLANKKRSSVNQSGVGYWFVNIYQRALYKRRHLKKQHQLAQRNLFIFPSLLGLFYLLFILLLWLLGTNYQNNLILALSYLLLSIMLISIFHCYFNMSGLKISVDSAAPVFCGDLALIPVRFMASEEHKHQGLSFGWYKSSMQTLAWDGQKTIHTLNIATQQRGVFQPPRLVLKSYYPLGLLRCWCLLPLDVQVLVYPLPELGERHLSAVDKSEEQSRNDLVTVSGNDEDEYQGLRLHRSGDSVNKIAWKQYARTGTLYNKDYSGNQQQSTCLDWRHYSVSSTEKKLQHICFDALQLSQQQCVYSLKLPGVSIEPGAGDVHLQQVLGALAMFEFESHQSVEVPIS